MKQKIKLIKPIEPKSKDFDLNIRSTATFDSPYVVALKQYTKDLDAYNKGVAIQEQIKFIEDVKRSSLDLCLRKYKITKI